MKIVLLGFMGSGKSTVSGFLAARYGIPRIEMDDLIVSISERASVKEIFMLDGEAAFRSLESTVAAKLSDLPEGIISTGGGVIENPKNIASLKAGRAVVIFLKARFEVLQARLSGDSSRPLFSDSAQAKHLYENRIPQYEQAAEYTVDTDGVSAAEVAEKIFALLRKK